MMFRAPLLLMSASAFHAGGRRAALLARGGSNTRLFSKGTSADDAAAIDALISKFSVSKDGTFITENALDTFHFIRPSGNPLSKAEYPAFVIPRATSSSRSTKTSASTRSTSAGTWPSRR